VAPAFGLAGKEPQAIVREVAASVKQWRRVAAKLGLAKAQIDRMASAFEHEDLASARA
jgi:serine/threonine-protein kinase HipA